jgi:hypothetical protein
MLCSFLSACPPSSQDQTSQPKVRRGNAIKDAAVGVMRQVHAAKKKDQGYMDSGGGTSRKRVERHIKNERMPIGAVINHIARAKRFVSAHKAMMVKIRR